MDLSKAYDCLPHDLLIAKLAAFDRTASSLITDYLTDCLQRVKIGSSFSSYLEIRRGILQGSLLGPILFNFFINDLMFLISETEACMLVMLPYIHVHLIMEKQMKNCPVISILFQIGLEKFQIFLESSVDSSNIKFLLENKRIKSSNKVKIL